jgi:hypothetical protein
MNRRPLYLLLLLVGLPLAAFAQENAALPDDHPVVKQLKAYNERDIDAFLACYAPNVEVYGFPNQLYYKGLDLMRQAYEPMFQKTPKLHCELVNRITLGNTVIDRERVTGIEGRPELHAIAIYEVVDNLIVKVYFVM